MTAYQIRPIPLLQLYWNNASLSLITKLPQPLTIVCYVWYIEGSGRKIVVDAGASAEMCRARYGVGNHIQSLEEGLSKAGIRPSDVDTVILTHLHWDHVALASEFTHARFIVQRAELEFAKNPHPAMAMAFDEKLFRDLDLDLIEGNKEIIPGIDILFTPGHTPGGQSVAVETANGLVIITGFCCTLDTFQPLVDLKSFGLQDVTPAIHMNVLDVHRSALRVTELADRIIPLHDAVFTNVAAVL
jgi:N-acyl homoserine lactone hydrolase